MTPQRGELSLPSRPVKNSAAVTHVYVAGGGVSRANRPRVGMTYRIPSPPPARRKIRNTVRSVAQMNRDAPRIAARKPARQAWRAVRYTQVFFHERLERRTRPNMHGNKSPNIKYTLPATRAPSYLQQGWLQNQAIKKQQTLHNRPPHQTLRVCLPS